MTTFGTQGLQVQDDELSLRIKALKDCIKEIEQKQEHLLERIDSRIATRPKYEYESDQVRNTRENNYVQTHVPKRNESAKKKYLNSYDTQDKHEYSIQPSPPKEVQQKPKSKRDVEIQVEFSQRMQTEPVERVDSLEDEDKTPQFSETKDFSNMHMDADRRYQKFENNHLTNRVSKFSYSDEHIDISDQSPQALIPEKHELRNPRIRDYSDIDHQIEARNNNVINSRKYRDSRISMTSRSIGSDSQYSFSNSKNLFMSSNKPLNKYEMHNDSFGSPDPKVTRSKRTSRPAVGTDEKEYERMFDNDHIIKELERQERAIDRFIPPSRIEPVPITLDQNDLAIAYQSSPDMISYQYEDNASPPRCKKTRQKLFHSPVHKKEEMQDTSPNYNCNPDNLAAMRARDLHCGRGSSPLRTKFKTPKSKRSSSRSKSRSNSPLKKSSHKLEYILENGVININTPSKTATSFARFEDSASPKDRIINHLKQTNSSIKNFQRKSKVFLSEDSQERGNP